MQPVVAAGNDGFLAAWLDDRSWDSVVMVTRLSETGTPLDPTGIALGRSPYSRPQVIWNGEAWLVFWTDEIGTEWPPLTGLMMARVHRDGTTNAPERVLVNAPPSSRARSIATNGKYIVIAHGGSGDIGYSVPMQVAVLTLDGSVIEDRIVETRHSSTPTVLVHGDEFVVGWNTERDGNSQLNAIRLDARGAAIDMWPRNAGTAKSIIELAVHGDRYLAFGATSTGNPAEYSSWSVSRDLSTVTPPAPLAIRTHDRMPAAVDGPEGAALLAFDAKSRCAGISAFRFDDQGHETGCSQLIELPSANQFAAAPRNNDLALVWVDYIDSKWILKGSIHDRSTLAQKTAARSLTESMASQGVPRIAGGSSELLAVWAEEELYARRFSRNGEALDQEAISLGVGYSPAVVFDGRRYAVAFIDSGDYNNRAIVVRFISPATGLLDDVVRIPIDGSTLYFSFVRSDSLTLVTWSEWSTIHAAGIAGTQLAIPPRKIFVSESRPVETTAAAWNGKHFLVTWNEGVADWDRVLWPKIFGMRLGADLQPADAQPRLLSDDPASSGEKYQRLTAVGDQWFMAWEGRNAGDIRIARIGADGASMDDLRGNVLSDGAAARLITIGGKAHVVWTTNARVLRVATLRSDGTLDPAGQRSIQPPAIYGYSFGSGTSVASLAGELVLTYTRVAPEAGNIYRAFVDVEQKAPVRRRSVR